MTSTILIADDDQSIRTVLNQALGRAGYDVRTTSNAATLWSWVQDGEGDLVITDVVMPDENGLDLIPRIRKIRPDLRIIVMSAQSTFMTAVKATERGAFEYMPKPFDINELLNVVRRALETPQATQGDGRMPDGVGDQPPLIGRSPAMQELYRTMARLMGTDLTVLIAGESGTGKELVARALHDFGKRRDGPFVAINMAARFSLTKSATCRWRHKRDSCAYYKKVNSPPLADECPLKPALVSSLRLTMTFNNLFAKVYSAKTFFSV